MDHRLYITRGLGCTLALLMLIAPQVLAQSNKARSRQKVQVGKPRFQISGSSPTTSPGLQRRGSPKIPVGSPRTPGPSRFSRGATVPGRQPSHSRDHHSRDHHSRDHHRYVPRNYYPLRYPYSYSPYYYYGPGYYYSMNRYQTIGPFGLPPVVLNGGAIYGPGVVQRQLGVARNVPARPDEPEPDLILKNDAAGLPPRLDPRLARDRAWRSIDFGDGRFAAKNFHGALQRYKEASGAAPNLGETYIRQGFSYVALGMYPRAFSSFQRGLKSKPDWAKSNFRINELYGEQAADKAKHLKTLAGAANDRPSDAKLWFLLGVALHFDGQQPRAQLFFQRAADLDPQMPELEGFMVRDEKKPLGPGVEF